MILAFRLWDLGTEHEHAEWIPLITKRQMMDYKCSLPFITVQILHFICSFTSLGNYAIPMAYQVKPHNTYARDDTFHYIN